ncbi:MAG: hypothetical protein RML93_09870, partial [Anaerolineales bacterium]|nr:ATP-binding protein [Anaerolineales bacterium]MDW8447584.1 hypothetical protein [Anaerolineales bacterium]
MAPNWIRFGRLLTDLLYRLKDAGAGNIGDLQVAIGQRMGKRGGDLVAKWRRGMPVARLQDVEGLVQALSALARNAGLPRAALERDLYTLLVLAGHSHPDAVMAGLDPAWSPTPAAPDTATVLRADWGRSPDVSAFVGREVELAELRARLANPRCRLVGIFGLGGIGKTFLAKRAAQEAAPVCAAVKWVLLQDGPPLDEVLAECIHFFSGYREPDLPASTAARIERLLTYFRRARCLLVLDKLEAVMRPGKPAGYFRAGYEGYADLLAAAAEADHRSCLIVVSREQPAIMARWEAQPQRVTS